jgi:phytoene dehydrogenase-like protein
MEPPPEVRATGWGRITAALRLASRLRSIDGADIEGLTSFLTISLGDFLEKRFASDKLRRLVLANSVYGKHGGPYQPGTAMGLLFHLLTGGDARQPGFQGHVIGGMGAITQAMRAACLDLGVTIRTSAPVARINQVNATVRGVTLESGEFIEGKRVVSSRAISMRNSANRCGRFAWRGPARK